MANQSQPNPERDIRVAATSRIWGIATGMLAICIPLSAATRSGVILPITVISGAAVGTVAVWRNSNQRSQSELLSPNHLQSLEQRISNLETIVSSEDLDLRHRLQPNEVRDRLQSS